ncbi:MAG: hypothetical protein AAGD11_06305 [Planctomycetota bacterium]
MITFAHENTCREITVAVKDCRPLEGSRPTTDEGVNRMADDLDRNGQLCPILVFIDDEATWVADGNHRVDAGLLRGIETLKAWQLPSSLSRSEVIVRSFSPNHVRTQETLGDAVLKFNILAKEHGFALPEFSSLESIDPGIRSKVNRVTEDIQPRAIDLVREKGTGYATVYAVVMTAGKDEELQVDLLRRNAAGELSKAAIEQLGKQRHTPGYKPHKLKRVSEKVVLSVQMDEATSYDDLERDFRSFRSFITKHKKLDTPIAELAKHLKKAGAS